MSLTYKYTSFAISFLRKLIGCKFTVDGIENIPKNQPILFVANHFTRSETFFIPHIINKHTSKKVRSLAHSSLYQGFLGKFLTSVGTISTADIDRDKAIVKDLIENNSNWIIYPEGSMVKNKKIEKSRLYSSHNSDGKSRIRTGSAVLALKSHLYRQDIIEAHETNNEEQIELFKKKVNVEYSDLLLKYQTHIVPICVTYYPIRPGENKIYDYFRKKIKNLSSRFAEELQVEGSLLQNSQINLHFDKPINLAQYIKKARKLIYNIPIIKNETKTNFVIKYYKHKLTTDFMTKVYSNLKVNIDHIFSAAIRHLQNGEIELIELKRIIYLSFVMMKKTIKCNFNESLEEGNLLKIFSDEPHKEFDSVYNLALQSGEITEISEGLIKINKDEIFKSHNFHQIRLKSTLQVIFNEFSSLKNVSNIVKRNCRQDSLTLKNKTLQYLTDYDYQIYLQDYNKYYDKKFSKDLDIGKPIFLKSENLQQDKAIVICHGYKSSPKEVQDLAKYINNLGFSCYCARLKGHATAPINIEDVTWQDWYSSLLRAYAIAKNCSNNITIIGFSTGGLLSLLSASRKNNNGLKSIISINSALRLQDVRSKFVPAINLWNDMLNKFKLEKATFKYIDDIPEITEFNYSRNYLHGVEELGKLMEKCEDSLRKIKVKTLIIQGQKDPVVNPKSAKIIYDKISSKEKQIFEPDFKNHIIINGQNKEIVFKRIEDFLLNK